MNRDNQGVEPVIVLLMIVFMVIIMIVVGHSLLIVNTVEEDEQELNLDIDKEHISALENNDVYTKIHIDCNGDGSVDNIGRVNLNRMNVGDLSDVCLTGYDKKTSFDRDDYHLYTEEYLNEGDSK